MIVEGKVTKTEANFPISQNKEPNGEGISSMPCMAISNIPRNAATLQEGRGR